MNHVDVPQFVMKFDGINSLALIFCIGSYCNFHNGTSISIIVNNGDISKRKENEKKKTALNSVQLTNYFLFFAFNAE
jgi:hypothetical protein